ncbi:retrovirus-related pol polyprotein from transposon TNT 1-94 [Tanacetum coccineum]
MDEGNVSVFRPSKSREQDDMEAYAFAIPEEEDTHEPIIFQKVINSSENDEWVRAMEEEMSSLKKNHTWEPVDQPPGQNLVSCKWLYKIKERIEGVQKPRVILSLTACEDYELEQLDVKTTCLHGNLEETIYMRQPLGFEEGTGNKEFAPGTGPTKKILGMEIVRDRGSRTLKVFESEYVQKILNNYIVDNGKSVYVPLGAHFKVSLKDCPSKDWDVERTSKVSCANVGGSVMYLMVFTRPDIAYAVSIVSMYLANPCKNHAVKWILKYLKGTADVGLVYRRDQVKHVDVDGFVDANYAKDPHKEAEYMKLTKAVKDNIQLKGLLIELGINLRPVVVNCDNQGAIHLSRNAMFHERTKHINVRYHFIREIVESRVIEVAKIGTKVNAADAFTQVIPVRSSSIA